MTGLNEALQEAVLAAGIDLVGVTSAEPLPVNKGVYPHAQPREVLPDARAVVVAGFSVAYEPRLLPSEPGKPRGRFTPYGSRVFEQMEAYCGKIVGDFLRERGYRAIAAPGIPAKPAAVRAGLGHYGRNTVVVVPELGSWVMFACVVTDAPLACADYPLEEAVCSEGCDACRRACPTGALTGPYKIARAKCITAWLWGAFAPAGLRDKQGTRLFGCGECLSACPRNKRVAPRQSYPVPIDDFCDSPELIPLLSMEEEEFKRSIPTFPRRAGIDAIRGNAVIALGNIADPAAVPALGRTLRDKNRQIRAYSAWALGRIGGAEARALLEAARVVENEPKTLREIELALAHAAGAPIDAAPQGAKEGGDGDNCGNH